MVMIVRRIPADKAAFQSYDPGLGLFRNNEKPAAVIQQVVGAAGCERYVVVIKAGRQYVGNQGIYGVGVVKGSPLYSRADVYAIVRIYVHDGRSFAIVKSAEGSTSDGTHRHFALAGHSVASFYAATLAALAELGIAVAIDEMPNELPDPVRFSSDTAHVLAAGAARAGR